MDYARVNRLASDSCGERTEFSDNGRERIMKKLLCALLLMLPIGAFADHIDVIEVQLNEGCSVSEYVAIKDDFNEQ